MAGDTNFSMTCSIFKEGAVFSNSRSQSLHGELGNVINYLVPLVFLDHIIDRIRNPEVLDVFGKPK